MSKKIKTIYLCTNQLHKDNRIRLPKSIEDNLGILALHTRISERQTLDHDVTVSEVKDIVDDAIYFATKRNLGHFVDLLVNKRYDENDMIILREKDFMHD